MDAIGLELTRHTLSAIADEMGSVLRRTSFSANIKERRDYSCAVYDRDGRTLAMGDHMPVHLGAMPLSVKHVRAAIRLGPGDVGIVNDPFQGGTHLPDITAVLPVFAGGRTPAFYVANRAHHSDVGGMSPGSMPLASEIYQEGLRIPPSLLVRRGKVDRTMMGLILANVRTPVEREGDLLAQWMSLKRGEQRLRELAGRVGVEKVRRDGAALLDYSERMMRAAIAGLPEGVYRFEDALDNDGISSQPIVIRVAVTVKKSQAHVDFTGTGGQAPGPVNANYAIVMAAVMYVFRCLIREDVPFTEGLMRPIRITAPEGSVINALPPAAMAAGNVETSQRITDVLLGALALAAPDRIPAASSGTMNNLSFGGFDSRRGRAFAYYETIAGGMGASARHDGADATHTHMTNSWNTPVEAFEHIYPVRIGRYRIRKGSGGLGRRRGGDGIEREFEFLEAAEVTLLSDRREIPPYGLAGGGAGQCGSNAPHGAKVRFQMPAGGKLKIRTPGGGGWGPVK